MTDNDAFGTTPAPSTLPPPPPGAAGGAGGSAARALVRRWTVPGGAVGLLLGGLVYVAGTVDVGGWVGVLAFVAALGVHGAVGAASVIAFGWPSPPLVSAARAARVLGAVALLIGAIVLDGYIVSLHLRGTLPRTYLLLAVTGFVAGLVLAFAAQQAAPVGGRLWLATRSAVSAICCLAAVVLAFAGATAVLTAVHAPSERDDAFSLRPVPAMNGTYLALGDSIASGDGLEPYLPGTDGITGLGGNACRRSPFAYPNWLTFEQGAVPTVFTACAGSTAIDLVKAQGQIDEATGIGVRVPAQTGAVDPAQVRLVTVSIGAEEMGVHELVVHCIATRRCLTSSFAFTGESDGRATGAAPSVTLREAADKRVLGVSDGLAGVFDRLKTTYTAARIVVVGQPHLFADERAPRSLGACGSLLRRLDRTEREGLREIEDEIDDRLYQLAVRSGLEYMSAEALWAGHEVCGDHDGYLRSPALLWTERDDIVPGGRILPTRRGQQLFARQVACYLTTYPTPPQAFEGATPARDAWPALDRLRAPENIGMRPAPGTRQAPLGDGCVRPATTGTGR